MVEVEKSFKNIVKKGSVVFGTKQTKVSIDDKKAKLVVLAGNCPNNQELITSAKKHDIPVYTSKADSVELGYLCGKAYAVSTFAVIDDAGVNVLNLLKKR